MNNNIPVLYVLVGLSGSGKSYYAKKLNCPIVSSDEIRKELWGNETIQKENNKVFNIAHKKIKEHLLKKENVAFDATNLTIKSRKALFQSLNGIIYKAVAVIIAAPYSKCLLNNKKRERNVPEAIVESQLKRFQIPFYEEGFDKIRIISPYSSSSEHSYSSFWKDMEGFEQKTSWHTDTLDVHCNKVAKHYSKFIDIIGAQLHDYGKLYTQTFDEEGNAHYYNHAEVGAYILLSCANEFLNQHYTKEQILKILFIVNYHMLPFEFSEKNKKKLFSPCVWLANPSNRYFSAVTTF